MIYYCLVAKTLLKVTFSQKVQFVFQISESDQIWSTNHTSWKKATFTTYLVFTFVIDISFQPNQCKGHLNWGGKRIGKNIWTFFYFFSSFNDPPFTILVAGTKSWNSSSFSNNILLSNRKNITMYCLFTFMIDIAFQPNH